MSKIYRTTDRIAYKIGEIVVYISPLSLSQKAELASLFDELKQSEGIQKAIKGVALSAKGLAFAIKDIKGLTNPDGSDYKLEFNSNELTESCVDDLMNIDEKTSTAMPLLCGRFLNGVPDASNLPDGVELVTEDSDEKNSQPQA